MGRSSGSAHYRASAQSLSHSASNESCAVEDEPLLAALREASGEASRYQPRQIEDGGSKGSHVKGYLSVDVDLRRADVILVICFFISGLIDSGAYNAYQCFTSMQTGNTIFAALGVSDLPVSSPKYAWTKSVCAVVAFLTGAITFGTLHHKLGQTRRATLLISFTLQSVLIAAAALMVEFGQASGSPAKPSMKPTGFPSDPGFPWADLIPIAFLSFQAAGKIVASRMLQCGSLPTVVLTTLYNDLVTDPALFTAGLFENVQRNRRAGSLVVYITGALIGGVLARSPLGFSGALWIATACNSSLAIAWALWKRSSDDETN